MRTRREVLETWSAFVENGAGYEDEVVEEIEARLLDSEIPGASVSRRGAALVVRLARLPGHRQEVRVQPYGAHLELEHRVALAPGLGKRGLALLLAGDQYALSRPRNPKAVREFEAAASAVRHQVAEAARGLASRIGAVGPHRADLDEVLGRW